MWDEDADGVVQVGSTQLTGTLTVGVDDTGHDVKFFGATAGAYMEWDENVDELELRGGAATPGKLLLSTAEATVVDGNKLGQIDFQAPAEDWYGCYSSWCFDNRRSRCNIFCFSQLNRFGFFNC